MDPLQIDQIALRNRASKLRAEALRRWTEDLRRRIIG